MTSLLARCLLAPLPCPKELTMTDPLEHPLRVALVDDQPLVRAGFAMVIDSQPDLDVVVQAADGLEAVEQLRDRKSTRLNSSHVAISYAVVCLDQNSEKEHVQ